MENREERIPHYLLSSVQAQMATIDAMNMTESSRIVVRLAGMKMSDALTVVLGLSRKDFFKSMTARENHRIRQDVYCGEWCGEPLYITFQQAGECFVVSFKEQ